MRRNQVFAIEDISNNNNDTHKDQIGISFIGTRVQYGNILITPIKNTCNAKKENMFEFEKTLSQTNS